MYVGLRVKHPSFLSDFNECGIFLTDFRRTLISSFMKIRPTGESGVVPCRHTDIADRLDELDRSYNNIIYYRLETQQYVLARHFMTFILIFLYWLIEWAWLAKNLIRAITLCYNNIGNLLSSSFLRGLSPRANYTDRAAAAGRRS